MGWMPPPAASVCQNGYVEYRHSLPDAASFRIILSSARSETAFRSLAARAPAPSAATSAAV